MVAARHNGVASGSIATGLPQDGAASDTSGVLPSARHRSDDLLVELEFDLASVDLDFELGGG